MSSVLQTWWREARAECDTERQAVAVIAAKLGESEAETRRVLVGIGRVKLGVPGAKRAPTQPTPALVRKSAPPDPDASAMRRHYRALRLSGSSPEDSVKGTARAFSRRPHDVRIVVGGVESECRREVQAAPSVNVNDDQGRSST